jgi:hypothetical protein
MKYIEEQIALAKGSVISESDQIDRRIAAIQSALLALTTKKKVLEDRKTELETEYPEIVAIEPKKKSRSGLTELAR